MDSKAHLRVRMFLSISAIALFAWPLFAQDDQSSPADSPAGWAFRWLNFAIVFVGILWFAVKICGPYFRARTEEIANKVAEGTRAREAAERQRQEAEAKLAGIDQDITRIRAEAKRSGEAEGVRLRETSKREAEMIERAADEEIAAARRAARFELKAFAARMAIERAQTLLREELTPAAEATLFQEFVERLAVNRVEGSRN